MKKTSNKTKKKLKSNNDKKYKIKFISNNKIDANKIIEKLPNFDYLIF